MRYAPPIKHYFVVNHHFLSSFLVDDHLLKGANSAKAANGVEAPAASPGCASVASPVSLELGKLGSKLQELLEAKRLEFKRF